MNSVQDSSKPPSGTEDESGKVDRLASKKRYSRVMPINLRPVSDSGETGGSRSVSGRSPTKNLNNTQHTSDESVNGNLPDGSRPAQPNNESVPGNEHGEMMDAKVERTTTVYSTHRKRPSSANERILELRGTGKHTWMPPINHLDTGASLIVRRIQKTKERQDDEAREQSKSGLRELQQTFVSRQLGLESTNWEFWASVVGDYATVARTQPDRLRKAIQDGFPNELRGLLWQVIASSKSHALEQLYAELVKTIEDAPCKPIIAKDLDRTPMAKQVERQALNRLLCAYSLFDPEVGYTQGMAFVAVPLLLELSESDAFSMFVQLMKTYDFRSSYLADMPGLHLRLYQFDRLLEDNLESVHIHLKRQGVQSTMYASQWFLTVFAYRFPPSLVTRIFDITIAEGSEALLRFAVALMEAAAPEILNLKGLDQLLPFLKERIFDKFDGSENELVRLASQVELLPQILSKFELEHQELNRLEKERAEQMDTLRTSNARLSLQNKNLESTLETLNGEHVQIVNKMIQKRWDMAHLQDENEELRQQLAKSHDSHSTYSEVASKLESLTSEVATLRQENEALQEELALLRKSQELTSTAELLKELKHVKETNLRYEAQLGSLQESLASALE